ncbi:HNH endonuclease [Streptomyces bottropensis]
MLTGYEYQWPAAARRQDRRRTRRVGSRARAVVGLRGPDDVDNGLPLCSLHHKLLDKAVLGIGDGHRTPEYPCSRPVGGARTTTAP